MRIACRSYGIADLGGSSVTMRILCRWLREQGDEVWASGDRLTLGAVREWRPDLVVAHQWATEEASAWAAALRLPFVMLVHGPGQYEHFMPPCDLVVFNTATQQQLAAPALGRTPSCVLHPPVFRADYETPGRGDCLAWFGSGQAKGIDIALTVARQLPDERLLLVTPDEISDLPANVELVRPTARVREVYERTRLLLVPSRHESFGRVAVEGAMSGIPSVVSDLPGLREATRGCAVVVERGQRWPDAVRDALGTLEARRADAARLAALSDPEPGLRELRRRLLDVAAAGRRRPTVTLCMTVANEAPTLERAVASVAGVVDEVVIGVDERSSDDTASIASRLATRTFRFTETSPPDFPRMRNRAMALVETDWAIVLDGHEWIEHADRIAGALHTTAWSIEIQTLFEPDERRVPALAFPFPRIHRRHVRFAGAPAHEEVGVPLDRRDSRRDIVVWHERAPGRAAAARGVEKSGGELDALRAAWERQGDRRALFYLANGLRESGRVDEAVAAYDEYLRAPNFPEEGWQARLYAARCQVTRGDAMRARRAFERAVLESPERAEAIVGLAHVMLEEGDVRGAAAWFRMAAALPEPAACRMFVEVPVYRWGAWHGLALALDRLGDYAGAAAAESRAVEGGAGDWAAANVTWWRGRAGADSHG